jgi:hypothetical protein
MNLDVNSVKRVMQNYSSYPTQINLSLTSAECADDNDDITVVASNCTSTPKQHANAMSIAPTHAIADTGATSIFVMAGTPAHNICNATHPIHISLPDRKKIISTQVCDVKIPGLPITLTGHIVPDMKMASLLGIRIPCKAGCEVIFDDQQCRVSFNGTTILTGHKDPASNFWTLPILTEQARPWTTPGYNSLETESTPLRPGPCKGRAPQHPAPQPSITLFSYHRTTKENAVKFMHQSLCNPPIASLLKAIDAGFLCSTPHLNAKSIRKYLTPSPATSKGHM